MSGLTSPDPLPVPTFWPECFKPDSPGSIPHILNTQPNTQPNTRPNTQPISLDRPLIGLPPLPIALKASQC
jgi:hypothetical protein